MKVILFIFMLLLSSCEGLHYYEQEEEWGCHSGKNEKGESVIIHCCTKQHYLNEPLYDLSYGNYTEHKWVKNTDCQCQ